MFSAVSSQASLGRTPDTNATTRALAGSALQRFQDIANSKEPTVKKSPSDVNEQSFIAELQQKYGKDAIVQAKDLDGDGRKEIVVLDKTGTVRVFKQNADGQYSLNDAFDSGIVAATALNLIEKDGQILIQVLRGDNLQVTFSQQEHKSGDKYWQADHVIKTYTVDVDGDQKDDEVITDLDNGKIYVSIINENGERETQTLDLNSGKFKNFNFEIGEDGSFRFTIESNFSDHMERGSKIRKNGLQIDYSYGLQKFDRYQYVIDTKNKDWFALLSVKVEQRIDINSAKYNITARARTDFHT